MAKIVLVVDIGEPKYDNFVASRARIIKFILEEYSFLVSADVREMINEEEGYYETAEIKG